MLERNTIIIYTLIICLCRAPVEIEAANILAISSLPQPAKYGVMSSILNGLNERGHQITWVIRFSKQSQLHNNIRQILIQEHEELYKEFISFSMEDLDRSFFANLQNIFGKGVLVTSDIINNPSVKEIMKHEQFDLIIFETFMTEALYGLGEYFNAPMVGISSFGTSTSLDKLVGNVSPTSFIPTLFIQHIFEVTFLHRFLNVALSLVDKMTYDLLYLPHQRKLYEEFFPNATVNFDQANRNFSLVLLNQHHSMLFPRPYLPNMIEVAGLHIDERLEQLPLNVQQFLDDAPFGVIYFHLAAGLKTFKLNLNSTSILFQTFKNLNYKIICNMDNMSPQAEKYRNILQVYNVSHHSILAHPHVKLFVTNGELLSIIDSVYYGKPILGLPMFTHQHFNINMAIQMGYGLGLKFKQLHESKLQHLLLELLNNPSYSIKVKELSAVFRDQPLKPKERALYWIEYVLRHKGAVHLRSKGRFLNIWQFNNIDVLLAYLVIFVVIVFGIWITMKCMYFLLFRHKENLQIKVKRN
ncbi:UDP-glucosyltransferase 2-like [Calliphora vicina]|uniref:UDP-glucosyltransferase 2-like n=1 Tax=Calliphora vicina TaxID=7373 RepID=UPI00325A7830